MNIPYQRVAEFARERARRIGAFVVRRRRVILPVAGILLAAFTTLFIYYYVHFSREIDARLSGQVFDRASVVFSAPMSIRVGENIGEAAVTARLRRALYAEGEDGSRVGTYQMERNRLEIRPGPLSYFSGPLEAQRMATVEFAGNRVASIAVEGETEPPDHYLLEPEPITTLFDQSRTKRRLIRYQDLSLVLVNAVLAAEDRRFFSHHGINYLRIFQAAFKDIHSDEHLQGGSTLTMQLARNFFLTPERTLQRKMQEMFLALLLEGRLTKQQIFELYANEVYLGQRGSFSIQGFAEASQVYFGKDVKNLTLPEAALLAGLIRGPNLYSPYRHAAQATRVRNSVLREMQDDGFATPDEVAAALNAPLAIAPQNTEGSQAPYFVDMVKDQLLDHFSERDLVSQSYRVYTTLDLDLQYAASEAVRAGMIEVDEQLSSRHRVATAPPRDPNQPQVAMVVIDPPSGQVRALVGGRNYAVSQLNHALAKRQPGSSFKPFVYAAALNSAVTGSQPLVTPATILTDEPTTFEFDNIVYEPRNYKEEYRGLVTLREALAYSLNSATVSLAQMIGYDKVRELAIAAGVNKDILGTPALALGSYDATPMEIASAYTIFSNHGEYVAPRLILAVRDNSGSELWKTDETRRQVLDPRVSYQMVSLMKSVIDHGTGAGVRSRGFNAPAAGKTGTSHDGWFVGFTTNLEAVVWVGFDDNQELPLSGAAAALPAWTEFMKKAVALPGYRNPADFSEPEGLVTAAIKTPPLEPGEPVPLALSSEEIFIQGTEPHQGLAVLNNARSLFERILHIGGGSEAKSAAAPAAPVQVPVQPGQRVAPQTSESTSTRSNSAPPKKPGVVRRFFGIFKRGGEKSPPPPPPESQDNPPNQE